MHIPLFQQIKRQARMSSLELRRMERGRLFIFKSISTTSRQIAGLRQWLRLCLVGCVVNWVLPACACVCVRACVPENTQPSLWEHIQHNRGAHQHRCFFDDPGSPKGGKITVGLQPQRGEREGFLDRLQNIYFCHSVWI